MFENMGLLKAKKASKMAAEAKPREILKHLCDEIESYAKLGLTVAVFDISKSKINMIKDTISSGEDNSGIIFNKNYYSSSYSNGSLTRS